MTPLGPSHVSEISGYKLYSKEDRRRLEQLRAVRETLAFPWRKVS
jgi:DNA-binding transcriptional MerR regulator